MIESRKRTYHTAHDGHRVSIATKAVEEVLQLLMHHGVVLDEADKRLLLGSCRQFAVKQQVAGFQVVRVLGKLFDWVATVQQDAFFTYGVAHLRPLNLKMIADAVSLHESTISRVTANKFMATPRGLFEMKYFFTTAIAASDGGVSVSSEAVRYRIKQLIDAEEPTAVLSDDALVDKLKEIGIEIARRTVAKYREGMGIASSSIRRREKVAAAPRAKAS